jgi:hypothetical protein
MALKRQKIKLMQGCLSQVSGTSKMITICKNGTVRMAKSVYTAKKSTKAK